MNADSYLERLGLDPTSVTAPDRETLARLQRAHVQTVPFETFAINGDPYSDHEGAGVSLALPDLYEKVVERERGGFCFELNGLFGWLLDELGFDADRVAAQMLSDGDPGTPANHHSHLVHLDRPYVVDVGMGTPVMRRPLPLGGETDPDGAGIVWRTVESDRPDADWLVQYRRVDQRGRDGADESEQGGSEGGDWQDRYIFTATPRSLHYFRATCDYFATSPESHFVGDPVATMATDDGHRKLTPETLTRSTRGTEHERSVSADEYHDILDSEFGLRFGSPE